MTEDRELDAINESRFEEDLPPVTRRQLQEWLSDEMMDTYGYDTDK